MAWRSGSTTNSNVPLARVSLSDELNVALPSEFERLDDFAFSHVEERAIDLGKTFIAKCLKSKWVFALSVEHHHIGLSFEGTSIYHLKISFFRDA